MTITVNIPEKISRELASQAHAQGLSIDTYVANILEHAISEHAISPLSLPQARKINRQEFVAALDAMAQYSDKVPAMPGRNLLPRDDLSRP